MTVGILALQGDFREHEEMLHRLGAATQQVRLPKHLDAINRLIIPGGESTTISKLLHLYDLLRPIQQRAADGMPVWGTCAGAILLAREVKDRLPDQAGLEVMDITVRRNAFGRQLDSFETDLKIPAVGTVPVRGVFIRAPMIESAAYDVNVLAYLPDQSSIVAAQQGHLLATTFHPELTGDDRLHRYFLEL